MQGGEVKQHWDHYSYYSGIVTDSESVLQQNDLSFSLAHFF